MVFDQSAYKLQIPADDAAKQPHPSVEVSFHLCNFIDKGDIVKGMSLDLFSSNRDLLAKRNDLKEKNIEFP